MSQIIPTGTIIPYAGSFTPENITNLRTQGWLPCDGALYLKKEYMDLCLSILNNYGGTGGSSGSFNVPDLRGRFVRGVSYNSQKDPDADSRVVSNPGGNQGNSVGSLQNWATGCPHNPFITNTDNGHAHNVSHAPVENNAYAIAGSEYGIWKGGSVNTSSAGEHTHDVTTGFDNESRPVNVYVNFIIKFSAEE
jgi:microcystin-dependent protein